MPDLQPGAYPIVVDSFSVTAGVFNVEMGDIWLINKRDRQVLHYGYIGGGPGAGIEVVASREFGALYVSSAASVTGYSMAGKSSGAVVAGGSGTLNVPTVPMAPQSTSVSGGPAVGGGASLSVIGTRTWFKKVYTYDESPALRLPLP